MRVIWNFFQIFSQNFGKILEEWSTRPGIHPQKLQNSTKTFNLHLYDFSRGIQEFGSQNFSDSGSSSQSTSHLAGTDIGSLSSPCPVGFQLSSLILSDEGGPFSMGLICTSIKKHLEPPPSLLPYFGRIRSSTKSCFWREILIKCSIDLQWLTGYLRLALVVVWNNAQWEKFNFHLSRVFPLF